MRVTKLIREYVEKQVREKYPPTPEEENLKALENKLYEIQDKINNNIEALLKVTCDEWNKELGIEDWEKNCKLTPNNHNHVSFSTWNTPPRILADTASRERKEKIERTVRDILLNLELGATRADLDKMLSEI